MPNDAARVISAHRIPGERLLWAGRPKQGLAFRGWDVLYVPFGGLLLVGGSIFIVLAISETGDPFLALFLSLWLLAAAYMAVGRFFVDARRRASTWYAVTNMRALIISGKELGRVQSVNLRSLQEITFTRRADKTPGRSSSTAAAAGSSNGSTCHGERTHHGYRMTPCVRQLSR